MAEAWPGVVEEAFSPYYPRIVEAIEAHPHPKRLAQLFADLARAVNPSRHPQTALPQTDSNNGRKRKRDAALTSNRSTSLASSRTAVVFDCRDVSFHAPARKKLRLQIVDDEVNSGRSEVRLVHAATGELEYALPISSLDQVFCLPVPEKQQRQSIFALIPKPGHLDADGYPVEQIVFPLNETQPIGVSVSQHPIGEGATYVSVIKDEFSRLLQPLGKNVTVPTATEFARSLPQLHRKSEKAYHVTAHRGSKEGYLFFLSNGIVFGFKKPLAFFPFSCIESISYTSVLVRTFNLVIRAVEPDSTEASDIEFSMLDQADFANIDEYVKRHGLNDASMAADRRAKAYNVNKVKNVAANGGEEASVDVEAPSELQRAEQQLQDEEDELEEDYEVSGGESDGEGEASDDDEHEYEDGGDEEAGYEYEDDA